MRHSDKLHDALGVSYRIPQGAGQARPGTHLGAVLARRDTLSSDFLRQNLYFFICKMELKIVPASSSLEGSAEDIEARHKEVL